MRILEDYNLPDQELFRSGKSFRGQLVWVPPSTMVIIGKGTDPALELIEENIERDNIPVIRRNTGGCSVILTPQMLVTSFVIRNDQKKKNGEYFALFNSMILKALARQEIENLGTAGISDITLNGLKIAGSAIYRNKDLVFFHVIINIAGDTALMERYLKIPPREPDYRQGRRHKDFVTSFAAQGYILDLEKYEKALKTEWLLNF